MPTAQPPTTRYSAFESANADNRSLKALGEHIPRFRFVLDDISAETDEALKARAMSALGRLVLWCLRTSRTPEQLIDRLHEWMDLVREVRQAPSGAAALATIWRYILLVNERREADLAMAQLMDTVGKDGKEELENVAEQLVEKGRQEGRQEGSRELLLKILNTRFGELPEAAASQVNSAGPPKLEMWVMRALTATTLAEVFDGG